MPRLPVNQVSGLLLCDNRFVFESHEPNFIMFFPGESCLGGWLAPSVWSEWKLCRHGGLSSYLQRMQKRGGPLAGQTSEYGAGYAGGERRAGVRDVP